MRFTWPMEVWEPFFSIKDNRLLIRFNNDPSLYIYTLNNNYKLKTSPDIIVYFFEDVAQVAELYDGRLVAIDYEGNAFEVTLFSKSYKINPLDEDYNFCLQLKNKKLLCLNKEKLSFCILRKKVFMESSRNDYLFDFKFAYQMSNKCLLLNDDNLLIVYSRHSYFIKYNDLFKDVKAIYENTKNYLLYYQTKNHLLIMSSKTFQIQTVINRKEYIIFTFLQTPLGKKNELMDFVEKINFCPRKFQEKLGHKVHYVIQISLNRFIATYRDLIFLYKL